MKLREIERYATYLIGQFLSAKYWDFRFTSARRRCGSCDYPWWDLGGNFRRKGRIKLSAPFCQFNPFEEVDNTIRHEIAHALAGPGFGHGPEWVRMCGRTGARPERLCPKNLVPPRYEATCFVCWNYQKRNKRPVIDICKNGHLVSWIDNGKLEVNYAS